MYNKDFFSFIPKYMVNKLETKLVLYKDQDWFAEAWEKYRDIAKSVAMRDIPDPDEFFAHAEYESNSMNAIEETGVKFSDDDMEDAFKASDDILLEELKENEDNNTELLLEIDKTEENSEELA